MEWFYKFLDQIAQMETGKRVLIVLGMLALVIPTLVAFYFLFKAYNLLGLATLFVIFGVLILRDSILERLEMRRLQKTEK